MGFINLETAHLAAPAEPETAVEPPAPEPAPEPEIVSEPELNPPATFAWGDLHRGDALAVLRSMEDDSMDSIVTDPPYGLSKEPDMAEVLTHWLAGDDYAHRGRGFMGKQWDSFVPGPSVWRECLRVLKPGGHLLCFAGSRTVDLMGMSIRLAGFEVRDQMQWLYGSGFPKSMDVSKAIDKALGAERRAVGEVMHRNPHAQASDWGNPGVDNWRDAKKGTQPMAVTAPGSSDAARWQGWGTALKPAHEPIIVARKPLSVDGKKATVAKNVLAHGTGAINIDGSRIATQDNLNGGAYAESGGRTESQSLHGGSGMNVAGKTAEGEYTQPSGRWPANVLLGHHEECEQVGTRTEVVGGGAKMSKTGNATVEFGGGYEGGDGFVGSEITSPVYECHEDCPVAILDAQSGERRSAGDYPSDAVGTSDVFGGISRRQGRLYADQGGASRFLYSAKTPKSERNAGLPEGMVNKHPTVKPVKLMAYLVRMVTPPGGAVLDPYCGSGSTGVGAVSEGFRFVGIDLDDEDAYLTVAELRIEHAARGRD